MSAHAHASHTNIEKKDLVDFLKAVTLFIVAFFLWLTEFSIPKLIFSRAFSFLIIYFVGEHMTALPHNLVLAVSLISMVYRKPAFMALIWITYFVSFIMLFSL